MILIQCQVPLSLVHGSSVGTRSAACGHKCFAFLPDITYKHVMTIYTGHYSQTQVSLPIWNHSQFFLVVVSSLSRNAFPRLYLSFVIRRQCKSGNFLHVFPLAVQMWRETSCPETAIKVFRVQSSAVWFSSTEKQQLSEQKKNSHIQLESTDKQLFSHTCPGCILSTGSV